MVMGMILLPIGVFCLLLSLKMDGILETKWTVIWIPLFFLFVCEVPVLIFGLADRYHLQDFRWEIAVMLGAASCLPLTVFQFLLTVWLDGWLSAEWSMVALPLWIMTGLWMVGCVVMGINKTFCRIVAA